MKIFSKSINPQEAKNATEESYTDEYSRSDEDNKKERTNTISMKEAMARYATDGIAANCDNILAFLQVVALKASSV